MFVFISYGKWKQIAIHDLSFLSDSNVIEKVLINTVGPQATRLRATRISQQHGYELGPNIFKQH